MREREEHYISVKCAANTSASALMAQRTFRFSTMATTFARASKVFAWRWCWSLSVQCASPVALYCLPGLAMRWNRARNCGHHFNSPACWEGNKPPINLCGYFGWVAVGFYFVKYFRQLQTNWMLQKYVQVHTHKRDCRSSQLMCN